MLHYNVMTIMTNVTHTGTVDHLDDWQSLEVSMGLAAAVAAASLTSANDRQKCRWRCDDASSLNGAVRPYHLHYPLHIWQYIKNNLWRSLQNNNTCGLAVPRHHTNTVHKLGLQSGTPLFQTHMKVKIFLEHRNNFV